MIDLQEIHGSSSNLARSILNYMGTMAQGRSLANYLRDISSYNNFNAMPSYLSKTLVIIWVVLICNACGSHTVSRLSPKEWLIYHSKLETKQADKEKAQLKPKQNKTIDVEQPSLDLKLAVKAWVHWQLGQIDSAKQIWNKIDLPETEAKHANQPNSDGRLGAQIIVCLNALGLLVAQQARDNNQQRSAFDRVNDLAKKCQYNGKALSALAWSLSLAHLKTYNKLGELKQIKRTMKKLLVYWQSSNQSRKRFEPVECKLSEKTDLKSQSNHSSEKFYRYYKCNISCYKRENTQLLLRKPWSIKEITLSNTPSSKANVKDRLELFTGPQFGASSLLPKSKQAEDFLIDLVDRETEQTFNPKLSENELFHLQVKASLVPHLMCVPNLPIFSEELRKLAPQALIQNWYRMIEQALIMQPIPLTAKTFDTALNNKLMEMTWSSMQQAWNIIDDKSAKKSQKVRCKNLEELKASLEKKLPISSDKSINETSLFNDQLRAKVVKCLKAGLDLPSSWFRTSLWKKLFNTEAPAVGSATYKSDDIAWLFADHLLALGASTRQIIAPLIVRSPNYPLAGPWLQAYPNWLPETDMNHSMVFKPELIIEEFQKTTWAPLLKGSVGQLLDQQSLYYNSLGEGLRRVLEIIRVNSRKGVEELGELRLPTGAHIIDLYQIKPNGGRRAPMEILETEGYSFSDLQIGDWLVAHYIEAIDTERRDGSVLTPKIMLNDADRAVWRRVINLRVDRVANSQKKVLDIVHRPISAKLPSHHLLKQRQVNSTNNTKIYELSYVAQKSRPHQREAFGLFNHQSPYLQVGDRHNLKAELNEIAHYLQEYLYSSTLTCKHVQTLAPNLNTQSIQAIATWLWTHIQRERPLFESPVIHEALARGTGHKGLILSAVLWSCGHQHKLYLARETAAIHDPDLSRIDDFPYLLIKHDEQWLDPQLPQVPIGLVHPQFAGGAAIQIWPQLENQDSSLELVPFQSMLTSQYQNTLGETPLSYELTGDLSREWSAPGGVLATKAFTGKMEHRFYGADGAILFEKMSRASQVSLKGWVEKQWSQWLGRSEVRQLEFEYSKQVLKLNYKLRVWLRSGQVLSINPQQWALRFAALKERKTDLYLSPVHQRVRLKLHDMAVYDTSSERLNTELLQYESKPIKSVDSLLWLKQPQARAPKKVNASFKLRSKEITVKRQQGTLSQNGYTRQGIELEAEWILSGGVIETKQYQAWKKFASAVDQREQLLIKFE